MPIKETLIIPNARLRQAVATVCGRDPAFRMIEQAFGALTVRQWPAGFASLVRVIVGQQLSNRAAQAIFQRLQAAMDLTPQNLTTATDRTLQQVGLSRAKIATCQRLSAAILSGEVDLGALAEWPEDAAIAHLTQIKGIGVWTAEVYLLFCLERLNSFPASDLAVQVGYQELKALSTRPTRAELLAATEDLVPYRGAAAHLLWHYYRHKK